MGPSVLNMLGGCTRWTRWVASTPSSSSVRLCPIPHPYDQFSHYTTCVWPAVDRVIQRKRREYLDPNSSSNMKKLNDDLQSIHSIMRKTIDDVLDR